MNEIFDYADENNSGVITRKALHEALENHDEEANYIFGSNTDPYYSKMRQRADEMQRYVIQEGNLV